MFGNMIGLDILNIELSELKEHILAKINQVGLSWTGSQGHTGSWLHFLKSEYLYITPSKIFSQNMLKFRTQSDILFA